MLLTYKPLYKIHNHLIKLIFSSAFLLTYYTGLTQSLTKNKYGLEIVTTISQLSQIVVKDSSMQMINLTAFIPDIILDLKYATKNNFLKKAIYPTHTNNTFLRLPAAVALKKANAEIKALGLTFKIWDAYRPYAATEKMWKPIKDDRYAANPKFGSGHNRGIAVDLTLADLKTGKELNMGTGFDNFSDTAHSGYKKLSADVIKNREILKTVLERNGFKVLDTEWWHFYLPDTKKYALMDLSFKALNKIWKNSISEK